MGKRTFLIYRRFQSSKEGARIKSTFRLAELSNKCEMKVGGAFGDGGPLTITYKDAASTVGVVTLKINSTDGTPWTEEDERAFQKRKRPAKP